MHFYTVSKYIVLIKNNFGKTHCYTKKNDYSQFSRSPDQKLSNLPFGLSVKGVTLNQRDLGSILGADRQKKLTVRRRCRVKLTKSQRQAWRGADRSKRLTVRRRFSYRLTISQRQAPSKPFQGLSAIYADEETVLPTCPCVIEKS